MITVSGPGKLTDTSTYLTGYAMGYLVDAHADNESVCREYTPYEALSVDFKGIGSEMEHQGSRFNIGTVVGYRPGKDRVEVLIELPESDSVESIYGKNSLISGRYADLSLQHYYLHDPTTNTVTKHAIEVSVCREGAREGSHITELYPSQSLLNSQTYEFLRLFASRYAYPAPPDLPDMTTEERQQADVFRSPELRAYVNQTLWPLVKARRDALLRLSGYITASKLHKTKPPMSAPQQSVAATPTIATPPVTANAESTIDSIVADLGNAATPPVIGTTLASAPTGEQKTATIVSPAIDNNAMAVDNAAADAAKLNNKVMLEQIKRELDNKNQQIAELTAKVNMASKMAADAEKKRQQVELKSKFDTFIGRCDKIWTERERTSKKDETDNYFKAAERMSSEEADSFLKERFEGLVACAKRDEKDKIVHAKRVAAARAVAETVDAEEEMMLRGLWQNVVASKNNNNVNVIPQPQLKPFQSTSSIVDAALSELADAADDLEPSAKKSVISTSADSGIVAASAKSSVTTPSLPSVVPGADGWAGEAYKQSLAAQAGLDIISVPSLAELKRGGYAPNTGVVRKSAQFQGKFASFQPRFNEEHQIGLKQWNPQLHNDFLASVISGKLIFGGKVVQSSSLSHSTVEELETQAKQGEQFCARLAAPL